MSGSVVLIIGFVLMILTFNHGHLGFIYTYARAISKYIVSRAKAQGKTVIAPIIFISLESIISSNNDSIALFLKSNIDVLNAQIFAYCVYVLSFFGAGFLIYNFSKHKYKLNMAFVYALGVGYNIGGIAECILSASKVDSMFFVAYGAYLHNAVFVLLVAYLIGIDPVGCIKRYLNSISISNSNRGNIH